MRSRKVLKLCAEVGDLGFGPGRHIASAAPRDPSRFQVTDAEREFLESAKSRGATCWRNGWPDFLVERDGKKIGIEVKAGGDTISDAQASMFAALESIGLDVFIWHPSKPAIITPWRKYIQIGMRDAAQFRRVQLARIARAMMKRRRDSTGA